MRHVLAILCFPAGGMALVMLLSALTTGGSDLQLIGAGIFFGVMVTALGLVGVMSRLEQIRDRKP